MSLENKINLEEKSLLKRFLNSTKSKLSKVLLAASLALLGYGCVDKDSSTSSGSGTSPSAPNRNPVIETIIGPYSNAWEGHIHGYYFRATDPDGDILSYSLPTAPAGASITQLDSSPGWLLGVVFWTPVDRTGTNYTEPFTLRVSDGKGGSAQQNYVLNVTNTGTVSGTIPDIDGNGLGNLVIDLHGPSASKGYFTATTLTDGSWTINRFPSGTNWVLEASDWYTSIFNYSEPNVTTSGNFTTKNTLPMILTHTIASTNPAYHDSWGNASFLQFLKYETATRVNDSPIGGPHTTVSWPSFPVSVFLNQATAPAGDSEDASGNPTPNSIPDYIDRARRALTEENTQSGITLLSEVTSDPTTGIRFNWPSTITGGASYQVNVDSNNANGSYNHTTIQVLNNQTLPVAWRLMKQGLGRALYNRRPSADNQYLMAASSTATGVTIDEGRAAKYNALLPHGTNIDWYVDQ